MAERLVNYAKQNELAIIELCDPPANTYTYEMMRQLDESILDARMDDNVHVLIVKGAGGKFFCAGANINMLKQVTPRFKYFFCLHANETLNRLEQTPKLVSRRSTAIVWVEVWRSRWRRTSALRKKDFRLTSRNASRICRDSNW